MKPGLVLPLGASVGGPQRSRAEWTVGKSLSETEPELPARHWSSVAPYAAVIPAVTESHYAMKPGAGAYFTEPRAYAI